MSRHWSYDYDQDSIASSSQKHVATLFESVQNLHSEVIVTMTSDMFVGHRMAESLPFRCLLTQEFLVFFRGDSHTSIVGNTICIAIPQLSTYSPTVLNTTSIDSAREEIDYYKIFNLVRHVPGSHS
jgi:hypothetical protein